MTFAPPPHRELDAGEPFSFLITNKEGRSLLISGGLLYVAFFLIVPLLMGAGYPIGLARSMVRSEPTPQPWKISHALDGLKLGVVMFVYYSPIILLLIPTFVASIRSTQIAGTDFNPFSGPFLLLNLFGQLYGLVLVGLLPAFITILATTGRMSDCFRPRIIRSLVSTFGWNYALAALLIYVASAIAGFGILLCVIGVFFTWFYAMTIQGHIAGQLARGWRPATGNPGIHR